MVGDTNTFNTELLTTMRCCKEGRTENVCLSCRQHCPEYRDGWQPGGKKNHPPIYKKESVTKKEKDLNCRFTKEEIQVANKHEKMFSLISNKENMH